MRNKDNSTKFPTQNTQFVFFFLFENWVYVSISIEGCRNQKVIKIEFGACALQLGTFQRCRPFYEYFSV